ncbi:type II toxin-antitoxin system RelE/ParE family toxin [Jiella sonneratiae]|uniref:Type II toxin-antitoxin system RelE/ParE family toxin n=1 Tax=Jiella sonneratiae TaxID=2816856 RepID=A0ABS3J6R3_9HYPH|nr:type II toxin-antitoxin system RelE/ParE family toxin [Jiella sonneratiae]MBO0904658.1 type II toxin-antitoxin system RelE/ParE family toxin [Jiella sonneratiae]
MAPAPLYSRQAEADIAHVFRQSLRLFGAAQARRYSDGIRKTCDDLAAGFLRGQPIDQIRPGYKRKLVRSHYVIFRFDAAGRLLVVRILHSRMKLSDHL